MLIIGLGIIIKIIGNNSREGIMRDRMHIMVGIMIESLLLH